MEENTVEEFSQIEHEIKTLLYNIGEVRDLIKNPFRLLLNYKYIIRSLDDILERGLKIIREEYSLQSEIECRYKLKNGKVKEE